MKNGFTLIELLIVIAIIAILAAIAIPNFLLAQVRAKVSRVQNDLKTLAVALEAYRVDENWYPPYGRITKDDLRMYPALQNDINDKMQFISRAITTPIAYISRIPTDPFANLLWSQHPEIVEYEYLNMEQHVGNFSGSGPAWVTKLIPRWGAWRMVGAGPDGDRGRDIKLNVVYDPTNGTVSDGDIVRCQARPENLPHQIPD